MSSRGVNKVILLGNCCADPETRYMPSGGAVTNISIATNEKWKDKTTGQPVEKAEFHRIIFFNKLAEIAGEYLKKGSKVYIEGSLRTRKWQNKEGADQYTTEIVASEMQMLDSRGDSQQNTQSQAPRERGNASSPPHTYQPGAQQQPRQQAPAPSYAGGGFDDFDSDIPF